MSDEPKVICPACGGMGRLAVSDSAGNFLRAETCRACGGDGECAPPPVRPVLRHMGPCSACGIIAPWESTAGAAPLPGGPTHEKCRAQIKAIADERELSALAEERARVAEALAQEADRARRLDVAKKTQEAQEASDAVRAAQAAEAARDAALAAGDAARAAAEAAGKRITEALKSPDPEAPTSPETPDALRGGEKP